VATIDSTVLVSEPLPVEIVFHPSWWHKHAGIVFDEDFFYHPARRVEAERKMEQVLYDRFGRSGLGADRLEDKPVIGAVHNAAGFLLSEMFGCRVEYQAGAAPQVVPADREDLSADEDAPFASAAFKRLDGLCEKLREKYGYLCGDVNWSGVLNLALDIRGQSMLTDMCDDPDKAGSFFATLAAVIDRFTQGIARETGSTSIAVNRNVMHMKGPVFLHSECSHTMISSAHYEQLLLPIDVEWSGRCRPFGIHYCGSDPHRHARAFAKIPHLDFLDVGWGGDVKLLRQHLPRTFFNLRLSPVEILKQTPDEIRGDIRRLVKESGSPLLTGVCCINMDDAVSDGNVCAIFDAVRELRTEYAADKRSD
jgi:hypothetical protein